MFKVTSIFGRGFSHPRLVRDQPKQSPRPNLIYGSGVITGLLTIRVIRAPPRYRRSSRFLSATNTVFRRPYNRYGFRCAQPIYIWAHQHFGIAKARGASLKTRRPELSCAVRRRSRPGNVNSNQPIHFLFLTHEA